MTDTSSTQSADPVDDAHTSDKAIVFAALTEAGIHRVTIDYDGGGDSGQIEGIEAWDANDQRIPFPTETKIKLAPEYPQDPGAEQNPAAAVETLVWHYLEQRHDGWENNDGAFGVFVFDVPASLITLEHNERYTEVNTIND